MERIREIEIWLDGSSMVVELDQEDMSEDEFWEAAVDYVLSNISIGVL